MKTKDDLWNEYDEWLTAQGHTFMKRQRTKKWWYNNHNTGGRYIGYGFIVMPKVEFQTSLNF